MPPPRSHSLEQNNYADHKKQPNPTANSQIRDQGNDGTSSSTSSSSAELQESAAKNENLIMGKHKKRQSWGTFINDKSRDKGAFVNGI